MNRYKYCIKLNTYDGNEQIVLCALTAGLIANYNSLLISIAMSAANVTEQFGDSALVGETRFDEDELVPHAAGRLMVIERVRFLVLHIG